MAHYFKAIQATGIDDGPTVAAKMKAAQMNDFANKDVVIRADGRVLHPLHLLQVKSPAESKYPYDFYKPLGTTLGETVFRSLSEGGCALP